MTKRLITVDGVTKGMREWSRHTGVPRSTITWRLQHGWPAKRAVYQASMKKYDWRCQP